MDNRPFQPKRTGNEMDSPSPARRWSPCSDEEEKEVAPRTRRRRSADSVCAVKDGNNSLILGSDEEEDDDKDELISILRSNLRLSNAKIYQLQTRLEYLTHTVEETEKDNEDDQNTGLVAQLLLQVDLEREEKEKVQNELVDVKQLLEDTQAKLRHFHSVIAKKKEKRRLSKINQSMKPPPAPQDHDFEIDIINILPDSSSDDGQDSEWDLI